MTNTLRVGVVHTVGASYLGEPTFELYATDIAYPAYFNNLKIKWTGLLDNGKISGENEEGETISSIKGVTPLDSAQEQAGAWELPSRIYLVVINNDNYETQNPYIERFYLGIEETPPDEWSLDLSSHFENVPYVLRGGKGVDLFISASSYELSLRGDAGRDIYIITAAQTENLEILDVHGDKNLIVFDDGVVINKIEGFSSSAPDIAQDFVRITFNNNVQLEVFNPTNSQFQFGTDGAVVDYATFKSATAIVAPVDNPPEILLVELEGYDAEIRQSDLADSSLPLAAGYALDIIDADDPNHLQRYSVTLDNANFDVVALNPVNTYGLVIKGDATLAVGEHVVTAFVTDTKSGVSSAAVEMTITILPNEEGGDDDGLPPDQIAPPPVEPTIHEPGDDGIPPEQLQAQASYSIGFSESGAFALVNDAGNVDNFERGVDMLGFKLKEEEEQSAEDVFNAALGSKFIVRPNFDFANDEVDGLTFLFTETVVLANGASAASYMNVNFETAISIDDFITDIINPNGGHYFDGEQAAITNLDAIENVLGGDMSVDISFIESDGTAVPDFL